jgi:hypothetical protein
VPAPAGAHGTETHGKAEDLARGHEEARPRGYSENIARLRKAKQERDDKEADERKGRYSDDSYQRSREQARKVRRLYSVRMC